MDDLQRVVAAVPLSGAVQGLYLDELQLVEARAAGASAVLLIARIRGGAPAAGVHRRGRPARAGGAGRGAHGARARCRHRRGRGGGRREQPGPGHVSPSICRAASGCCAPCRATWWPSAKAASRRGRTWSAWRLAGADLMLVGTSSPRLADPQAAVRALCGVPRRARGEALHDGRGPRTLRRPFGPYGGRYVPETLMAALDELAARVRRRPGRPGILGGARPPAARLRGPAHAAHRRRRVWPRSSATGSRWLLKREDLNHTGAHKINNTLGQALLARRMGKRRIIAETGAGQHGVATATVCATLRARVRGLHGRRGHAAPAAQRVPHGADGRAGGSGDVGNAHAEGRHQRGACATGSRTSPTRTTSSARWWGPIRSRAWCAISRR